MGTAQHNKGDGLLHLVVERSMKKDKVLTKYDSLVSVPLNNYEVGCIAEALLGYSLSLKGLAEEEENRKLYNDLIEKKEHIDMLYKKYSELYQDEEADE